MPCRGIRGATTVTENSASAILTATCQLLEQIISANDLRTEDVASAIFTVTPDLNVAFPAQAAVEMGWDHVPLLDVQEMTVAGSLPRCIRVLIQWNTERTQDEVRHVYLGEAKALRPDLWTKERGTGPRASEQERRPIAGG